MNGSPFPEKEVAVVVIRCGEKILVKYNPRWGSFSLPMTGRKAWKASSAAARKQEEEWSVTAARAAAEALGATVPSNGLTELGVVPSFSRSNADGNWKDYTFHVFKLDVPEGAHFAPGVMAEWLTLADCRDREPISPTVRDLLDYPGVHEKLMQDKLA